MAGAPSSPSSRVAPARPDGAAPGTWEASVDARVGRGALGSARCRRWLCAEATTGSPPGGRGILTIPRRVGGDGSGRLANQRLELPGGRRRHRVSHGGADTPACSSSAGR
jgi:hypothetical protein